jgi:hypothetical protein
VSNKIETEILIHAVPERVWTVLMDFGAYSAWNPFILAIEGKAEPGETLRVTMRPPGGKAQSFKPEVLRADGPEAFVWRGSLPIPGLFTGEHSFQLTRAGDDTRLRHSESFSGVLVPLLRKMLARTEEGFNQMNAALKARAETRK